MYLNIFLFNMLIFVSYRINFVNSLIKLKNSLKLSFVKLRIVKISDNIRYMFELINDDNNNNNK